MSLAIVSLLLFVRSISWLSLNGLSISIGGGDSVGSIVSLIVSFEESSSDGKSSSEKGIEFIDDSTNDWVSMFVDDSSVDELFIEDDSSIEGESWVDDSLIEL